MSKAELFSHFAERLEITKTKSREYFEELTKLAEKELSRSGEFVLPGMVKLVVRSVRCGWAEVRQPVRRSKFRQKPSSKLGSRSS